MAVLLDVVFNHVGEPAHLMFIDKLYYFEQDASGQLANWSGCGNDLRAGAAMSKRLIIDSCTHLIRAYGVDGFRFDLAELLGVEVLKEIEVALKTVKPDLILIAEPWSFRGHIAAGLRDTGWASWNDGYRDFRAHLRARRRLPRQLRVLSSRARPGILPSGRRKP
jgi:pullulanase